MPDGIWKLLPSEWSQDWFWSSGMGCVLSFNEAEEILAKGGAGEQCKPEDRTIGNPNVRLRRDGTEYNLRVLIQFNGEGEFSTNVWIDGKSAVSGFYQTPKIPGVFKSKNFYFKQGVYSKNMFDYQMTSRGMVVKKVKVSQ